MPLRTLLNTAWLDKRIFNTRTRVNFSLLWEDRFVRGILEAVSTYDLSLGKTDTREILLLCLLLFVNYFQKKRLIFYLNIASYSCWYQTYEQMNCLSVTYGYFCVQRDLNKTIPIL